MSNNRPHGIKVDKGESTLIKLNQTDAPFKEYSTFGVQRLSSLALAMEDSMFPVAQPSFNS